MAVTYYYGDPRQFQGYTSTLRDENSLLDYWFYPNRMYMEEVRRENLKQEEENKKKEGGKGKGGGGGGGGGGGEGGGGGGKKKGGGGGGDGENKDGEKKGGDKQDGGKKEDNKPKVIELKVHLCCEACARKVRKKIEKLDGVERGVITDMDENKVTVKASTKPEIVLKQAQKVKRDAELWPQKKKEPEKKKDDNKKGDNKKGNNNNSNKNNNDDDDD
ncbi:hypothetical protein M758_1G057300 [Ceratodon purpureus]|uniref:HMA domain-containing protein n=1 Tax=Ceratodon purpureus TaxID=3225 RepID=A0A8T0J4W5_CERPU|nr:hypothetical protein KC19_1G059000 [Ceratodon purpureus]KAG0628860.1 hypothetical protein M758_1G057300 [Ceratodon purpureus]